MSLQQANKIFGLRLTNATKNNDGDPINFNVLEDRTDHTKNFVPERDAGYVFPVEAAMTVAMSLEEECRFNVLLWGFHGSGKSTLAEQVCSVLNRPTVRVQHSVDTEAADVVGQWVLEGDKTVFHYGPLARAMRDGLVYIADEYDFALPNVLAVYQAILEGAPLFIKQAPEHMSIVKPHKDFRFIATGNTNGSGDETGLYQGTQIQNAANYSRFHVTLKIDYQDAETEKSIIRNKIGSVPDTDLEDLLKFTKLIREAYDEKSITNTISTRELITLTKLAVIKARGAMNWQYAIEHAFRNRMSSIDSAAIDGIAKRVFEAS